MEIARHLTPLDATFTRDRTALAGGLRINKYCGKREVQRRRFRKSSDLHLLGVKNDESFLKPEKRGKRVACDYGDECKHAHPESVTKSAALNILKK